MSEEEKKSVENASESAAESKAAEPVGGRKGLRAEIKIGVAAAIVICILGLLFGTHVLCIHQWDEATCVNPVTCELCGQTKGKALGHKWKPATCTLPKRCGRCGEKKGHALGHDYRAATCTEPETCERCYEPRGVALGHDVKDWNVSKEATCTEQGTKEGICSRCGAKVSEAISKKEHTPGDWEITKDVTITSSGYVLPGEKERKCTVCGTVIDKSEYKVDVTTSQVNALSRASSYLDMGGFSYKSLVEQLEFEGFSNADATFAADHCGADWMKQVEQKAKSYMSFMGFSRSGLIGQLEFEGFTPEQAAHGADYVGL